MLGVLAENVRNEMLATKWMHFPLDVLLAYIRWYPAYPLNNRHLEEMMRSCWLTPSIVQSICTKPPSLGDQSKTNWTAQTADGRSRRVTLQSGSTLFSEPDIPFDARHPAKASDSSRPKTDSRIFRKRPSKSSDLVI